MNFKAIAVLMMMSTRTSWALKMDFEDCGTVGILYYVDIEGCYNDPASNPDADPNADPGPEEKCIVERGASIHGEVQFEAGSNSEYLDCEIFGIINGLVSTHDYTLQNPINIYTG